MIEGKERTFWRLPWHVHTVQLGATKQAEYGAIIYTLRTATGVVIATSTEPHVRDRFEFIAACVDKATRP